MRRPAQLLTHDARPALRWSGVFILAALAACGGGGQGGEAPPAFSADDLELLAQEASDALGGFGRWLQSETVRDVPWSSSPGPFRLSTPADRQEVRHGDFTVQLWRSSEDKAVQPLSPDGEATLLSTLRAQLLGRERPQHLLRSKFKVVRIAQEGARVKTHVRAHLVLREAEAGAPWNPDGPPPDSQVDAMWVVTWEMLDGRLLLDELEVQSEDRVTLNGPGPFRERTRGWMRGAGQAASWLGVGGAEWARTTDRLGETPFFGHNGMAVGDVNGDGREDLYVGMPNGVPNLLLVQQPDGSVREEAFAREVAWLDDTKGCLLVDLDGDGDRDLVCALSNVLAISANVDGKGRFRTVAQIQGPSPAAFYSLAAGDVDGDGDLDLFATRYVQERYSISVPVPFEDARNGPTNLLVLNEGQMRWREATAGSGLDEGNDRWSLAASFCDVDGDRDPDLYIANDFGKNQLYRNDGGRFLDVAGPWGVTDQAAGMGVSWADADGDGSFDLHVTNMFSSAGLRVSATDGFHEASSAEVREGVARHALGNSLFLGNRGRTGFRDASDEAGIRMGRWGWGGLFSDLDGDGRPDLALPNGFLTNSIPDDL